MNSLYRKLPSAAAALAAVSLFPQVSAQEPPPPKDWETSLGLNLGLSGGNSKAFNLGGNLLTVKEWGATGANILSAGADVNYGTSTTTTVNDPGGPNESLTETDTTNVNNYGGFLSYDRLLTDRLYVGARITGRHDDIAGLDYRIAPTATIGYYLIKKENLKLALETGPGYVWEQLKGTGANDYATIRFADNFEWKFTEKSRLFQSFEFLPQIDDWSNYVLTGAVGVDTELYKNLSLQVVFRDWYRSEPAKYEGTSISRKNNDYRLTAGVVYKFN
ncbi:MAG: DUF481 domain-containing protein [Verrucomicrobiae bacterium]|nr:DUF481 domain-containing protein [Verrucomicrobiae bacterium]